VQEQAKTLELLADELNINQVRYGTGSESTGNSNMSL
jgi:hypothetical protein